MNFIHDVSVFNPIQPNTTLVPEVDVQGDNPKPTTKPDAESATLADLMRRADTLSYRAWSENWNKTDKELTTELRAKLLSEAGKLSGALETYFGRSQRPYLDTNNFYEVEGELGDVMVVLLRIASIIAVDPMTAISKTLDKFEKRLESIGQ